MVVPLLEIKTRPPDRRPGAVARPRLVERVGPPGPAHAGVGARRVRQDDAAHPGAGGGPVARVGVGRRPRRRARPLLVLRPHRACARTAALGLLPSVDAALAALLNDLSRPEPLTLVIDDYHLVESRDIHDAMAFLVEHLPSNVHLVIATRADPPLPLSRLRARGELVEVRAADLRFTDDEAADYLAGTMGLALTAADVAALAERTEGWAAALQLAGLSLQGRADPGAVVARFAGDDRFIVDYLADEVLARLPADVHDFLLRTSVLERLDGTAVRRRHGAGRRRRAARRPRAGQPLPRPARRPAPLVPLPPPVRRRPARAPDRAAARPGRGAAPAGLRMAAGERRARRGDRARPGGRGLPPRRGPDGARHACAGAGAA